jgi:serine protease Do
LNVVWIRRRGGARQQLAGARTTPYEEHMNTRESNFTKPERWLTATRLKGGFVGTALVAALLIAGLGGSSNTPAMSGASFVLSPPLEAVERRNAAPIDSYADLVETVAPAVVTIRAERIVRAPQQFPFFNDPLFREFFGDRFRGVPEQQERRQAGLGSGVIVHPDGYVITNHHVIDGAEEIKVELTDLRTFDAKLVGSDPPSDLAVLKIAERGLQTLTLGDSNQVRVGDVVLAVGNPLGVGQTVTMGIISAKGRTTGLGDGSFEDFLQTDAPVNRGNSGGALVNTRGELVGINSQILSPTGGNIGIGFAIPANMARDVLEQIVRDGAVRRGMLGVNIQSVTSEIAESLGLPRVGGALVSAVQPGSAAERAGLQRGDVIVRLNNEPVEDSNSLRNEVARRQPGTDVQLTVLRNGDEKTLEARLDELPVEGRETRQRGTEPGRDALGLTVEPITPQMANRLGVKEGVVVRQVQPGSPAARAGIRPGDIIEEVNRQPVNSQSELRNALEASGDRPSLLLINRQGQSLFFTIS